MNELEIKQCLCSHPLTRDLFRGVFARDEILAQIPSPRSLYVISTDIRSSPGQHWLFCIWPLRGYPLYFDSYGERPLHKEIEQFLLESSPKYYFNNQQLQGLFSDTCGHYVTYVASQLCAGNTLQEIRDRHFSSTDLDLNDIVITSLFQKTFGFPSVAYKSDCNAMSCQCFVNHGRYYE